MEGERFDDLIRNALHGVERRGVIRAGIGTLTAAVLTAVGLSWSEESEAKKKKKKKKKKPPQSPPPTSPPPSPSPPPPPPPICAGLREPCAGECCAGLTCDVNPICNGFDSYCCRGVGGSCSSVCHCCGDDTICNPGGTCQSCGSGIACVSDCCQVGSEICTIPVANGNNASCQAGSCPANTNFCNSPNLNFCTNNCICATSVGGTTVCTDLNRDTCDSCTTDAQCGAGRICINSGPLCGDCEGLTKYCVNASCPPAATGSAATTNLSSFMASQRVSLPLARHHAHAEQGSGKHGHRHR